MTKEQKQQIHTLRRGGLGYKDSLVDRHIRQYREVLLPQQRTDRESYICCVSLLRQASGADTKEKAAEILFDSVSGDMVEQES